MHPKMPGLFQTIPLTGQYAGDECPIDHGEQMWQVQDPENATFQLNIPLPDLTGEYDRVQYLMDQSYIIFFKRLFQAPYTVTTAETNNCNELRTKVLLYQVI